MREETIKEFYQEILPQYDLDFVFRWPSKEQYKIQHHTCELYIRSRFGRRRHKGVEFIVHIVDNKEVRRVAV
jgi:hypothetical protein